MGSSLRQRLRRSPPDVVYTPIDVTSDQTFSPIGGPSCGTTYEFRVLAHGDGVSLVAEWSEASGAVSETTDACQQAPTFDPGSYDFSIAEDAGVGDLLGSVSATYPDPAETVSYSITAGNDDGNFAIDSGSGEITVAAALDHEAVPSYTLTVEATIGRGGAATVDVPVTVTDVNEPPAFDPATYDFSIAEDAAVGDSVGTVFATDPDAGDSVTYSITAGNDDGNFAIDSGSGEITVAAALDYEAVASYTLTVEASEGGGGAATVDAPVTVTDVNEPPAFVTASYDFSVSDDAAVGDSVGTVSTTDPDGGDTVTYAITAGNDDGDFAIDSGRGEITAAAALDREATSSYTLTVEASDGVGGSGTATVNIAVVEPPCTNGTTIRDPDSKPGLVADCKILWAARQTLAGTATLNWSGDIAFAAWEGVIFSYARGVVKGLKLQERSLTGSIPGTLGNLSSLRRMWLYNNQLTGNIPTGLGNLSTLEALFLDNNQLTGSIPTELGNLSSLEYLSLPNNQLTGSIPTELSNLSNLLWINLYGNQLTGCIPPALEDVPGGDLSHLGLPYCEDTEYAAQDSSEEPESPGSESVRRDLMAWADHDVIMLVWRAPHNMTVTGYQILRRLEGGVGGASAHRRYRDGRYDIRRHPRHPTRHDLCVSSEGDH